jgi:hypothetical protein
MAIDTETRASRRNILVAALGGLGGLLAGRLGNPESARAIDGGPALIGTANTGTTVTSFENTDAGETSLKGLHASDGKGVEASVGGTGYGLYATATATGGRGAYVSSLDATGVWAASTDTTPSLFPLGSYRSAVVGTVGDTTDAAANTDETAVYGFSDVSFNAVGVWGDTVQGIGVAGTGDWGLFGSGNVAVRAIGPIALYTTGKLVFAGRGGHARIAAGRYYLDVAISGMTSAADVIATLRTRKTGYFIAAVVSYNGFFRMFLNKTATTSMYFNFLVLN